LRHAWATFSPSLEGALYVILPHLKPTSIEHPAGHMTQVLCPVTSGMLTHRVIFAEMAPVGHTSSQAPQKTHELSTSGPWKAVPIVESWLLFVNAMAPTPLISEQTRTHLPQRMQRL